MRSRGISLAIAWAMALVVGGAQPALAHCDALDGPVVTAARRALDKGDVSLVLPWVQPRDEAEVQRAFDQVLRVRLLGPEAQALSDRWFFETLVRIHRAGEGAPFDGLKPSGGIPSVLVEADRALDTGRVDALATDLAAGAAAGVRERFGRALETRRTAGESVQAARRHVASYVEYVHYVEALHTIGSGGAEAHAPAQTATHAH